MKGFPLRSFIIAAIIFSSESCTFFSTSELVLRLPSGSTADGVTVPDIESWLVEYPERLEGGLPVYAEFKLAASETDPSDIRIRIARGINLPVTARPVYRVCGSLRAAGNFPAGAVFPVDVEDGVLELKWQDGPACGILKSCLFNSDMTKGFDTLNFRRELAEKSSEFCDSEGNLLPGGAWTVDPEPIISRLGYGLFRTSSIRAAETRSFSVPVQAGSFISDNPLYPPVDAADGSLEVTIPVKRCTTFFNPGPEPEMVELYFDENFWCWLKPFSGESESGRM